MSVDKIIMNEQKSDQKVAQVTGNSNAITPFSAANQAEIG